MTNNKEREGEFFVLSEAILWGLFPVVTVLSYQTISPLVTWGWSAFFATVTFGFLMARKNRWKEILNVAVMRDILLNTLFVGILLYACIFFALKYTSPGNVSILGLVEIFFTFLFFNVWRREYIPREHALGALLMVLGAGIILYPNFTHFQSGDFLAFFGYMFPPIGNFFGQKARKLVSAETIMFVRSAVVTIVAFAASAFLRFDIFDSGVKASLSFLLINGVVLFGFSKMFWFEGIHRISVTKAISLASVSPLFTLFFIWIFLGKAPNVWQFASFLPLFVGVILLSARRQAREEFIES